ncbi:SDR family NAD(P)-dependent oxidoreductase [Antarcticirhabdus aurantiaca]|uniref:SDR family NAD(P)-dependent oxidoreductase n=1 Tax=Antarcticirhabdus aurantiaca TaxID=2606717 RepID=A0ACD4NQ03_9HYPH|nr:SDR family NAD(P)-dependent oxidoreductase [Antarcticirhabdus aurantiaca]WAJ28859.1 SDR family NAD(P)-dependent oxidoreductase [Jeongeuplla avenae]
MSKLSSVPSSGGVAIVTGASGGIGLATAKALAKEGYRVFGTTRRSTTGSAAGGVQHVTCDVTSDASVAEAGATVEAAAGRIDLLVNNAGVGLLGAAEESSIEQIHELFDTNLHGTIRMTVDRRRASTPIGMVTC